MFSPDSVVSFHWDKARKSDQSDHLNWDFFLETLARAENRKILRRVAENDCIAAQLPELSRRPEGEEFRAAETKGGKNGRRASARRELQDIAGLTGIGLIHLGYKEIARAVKGQPTRYR